MVWVKAISHHIRTSHVVQEGRDDPSPMTMVGWIILEAMISSPVFMNWL